MEVITLGAGGKDPTSILALYIMTLMMAGQLDAEPTKESVAARVTQDLDRIFEGYEAQRAAHATDVSEPPVTQEAAE